MDPYCTPSPAAGRCDFLQRENGNPITYSSYSKVPAFDLEFLPPKIGAGMNTRTCLGSNDGTVRLMLPALPASYLNNFNNKDLNLTWELLTHSSVRLAPMSIFSALGPDSSKNSRPGRKIKAILSYKRSSKPVWATEKSVFF